MNRNFIVVFILTAALFTAAAHASQPTFTTALTGGTLREMDWLSMNVTATDPTGHPLEYIWSITSDETGGKAFLQNAGFLSADLAVRWKSAVEAGQLDGKKIEVQVVARHANSADGTEEVVSKATFTVSGVNHPPVPVISGKLGTPTDRIPTGYGVCADGYGSNDPDEDGVRGNWDFGPKSGGRWKTPYGDIAPALIGSEGGRCCFTVIDMTAPIDQQITLTLVNGLHSVTATATCYLKPSGAVTPGNSAPTVTIQTNPVSVLVGAPAQLVADAEDVDGDALTGSFVFLQTNTTVATTSVAVTSTKRRFTASVPTTAAGTFEYRFTARESSTTDHKTATQNVTLIVGTTGTPGDGGPGDVTDTPDTCDSSTGGPPSITVSPNPTTTKPLFKSGTVATISVVSSDPSEKPHPLYPTTQRGVTISWIYSELTALGAQPTINTTVRTGDPKTSDSVFTFTVPPVTTIQDVDLTVISRDVYDCTHTYRFAIRLEPGSSTNNQPPVAKIQYKVGSLSNFENAPTTPVTVQTDIARTITLKGDTSTDDGGTANLAYTWVKVDSITGGGVTLSSNSGATTTLQVLAHTNGTVNVTLTAKDKGNLTGTATISFNIADPAKKPTARATVKVGNQALTGVVSEGTVVTLDGSASSRQDNTSTGLTYQWTQTEGPIVTITDANKAVATFTAPAATETASQLKFKLIVTDGGTPSDPVEVTVSLAGQSFYFSQVAVGPLGASEFRTVLMLVNQNTTPATGVEVKFFGQDGNSMPVTINDEPWDSAPFDIPALGSKRLVFSGQDLKAGWAQVNSSVKITGLLRYQVVGDTENLETEVGLYSTEAARKFATFFDRAEETAIAVANPNAQPAKVRIRLIDDKTPTGDEVVSKYLFVGLPNSSLPAMNHRAQFVDHELLGTLPSDFSMGTLIIESDVPVTITVVRTRGGVVFSTLPVASMK